MRIVMAFLKISDEERIIMKSFHFFYSGLASLLGLKLNFLNDIFSIFVDEINQRVCELFVIGVYIVLLEEILYVTDQYL